MGEGEDCKGEEGGDSTPAPLALDVGMVDVANRKQKILRLYRHILRHARVYPSIKREAIVEEIKNGAYGSLVQRHTVCTPCTYPCFIHWSLMRAEFREGRSATDEREVRSRLQQAVQGLQVLKQYSSLDPSSLDWEVDLGPDKLLQADADERVE